jgi:hypothetical protein
MQELRDLPELNFLATTLLVISVVGQLSDSSATNKIIFGLNNNYINLQWLKQ